jgi:purine-binding chemotaxis protein CheW
MDVRARFKLPARDYDERTCVVVVNVADNVMGLVVDHVNEVMDIPVSQVEPPPAVNANGGGKYVKGVGKVDGEVIILLEVECLLG